MSMKMHTMLRLQPGKGIYLVVRILNLFILSPLKKFILGINSKSGCARRGVSGALYPKSASCGAESPLKGFIRDGLSRFDRPPRNRRS